MSLFLRTWLRSGCTVGGLRVGPMPTPTPGRRQVWLNTGDVNATARIVCRDITAGVLGGVGAEVGRSAMGSTDGTK